MVIAHEAIEEETRYSVCPEEAFGLYRKEKKEKEKKAIHRAQRLYTQSTKPLTN